MEEDGADIVEVSIESEEAPPTLIGPDLDLVVISPRYEQRLRLVKVNPSYRTVVLLESINQCAHAIVP